MHKDHGALHYIKRGNDRVHWIKWKTSRKRSWWKDDNIFGGIDLDIFFHFLYLLKCGTLDVLLWVLSHGTNYQLCPWRNSCSARNWEMRQNTVLAVDYSLHCNLSCLLVFCWCDQFPKNSFKRLLRLYSDRSWSFWLDCSKYNHYYRNLSCLCNLQNKADYCKIQWKEYWHKNPYCPHHKFQFEHRCIDCIVSVLLTSRR